MTIHYNTTVPHNVTLPYNTTTLDSNTTSYYNTRLPYNTDYTRPTTATPTTTNKDGGYENKEQYYAPWALRRAIDKFLAKFPKISPCDVEKFDRQVQEQLMNDIEDSVFKTWSDLKMESHLVDSSDLPRKRNQYFFSKYQHHTPVSQAALYVSHWL